MDPRMDAVVVPSLSAVPGLLASHAQIAAVHLSDHARQVVAMHDLQRDDVDGAVVSGLATDAHRLQLRFVDDENASLPSQ